MSYFFWLGAEAENYWTADDFAEAYAWADSILDSIKLC